MMEKLHITEDLTFKIESVFWLFSCQGQKADTRATRALVRFPEEVSGEGVR